MSNAKPYSGPFPTPSAYVLEGAIGWRFVKKHVNLHEWEPVGYEIVFPDSILTIDMTGMAVRDSVLHSPEVPR